ncbi:MAG: amidohydrolase family protein [Candidatus Lokiarchaeota archaeon]|nr:amidohydrolase family protein [Candidatus Lokiarchaeota archaeon]
MDILIKNGLIIDGTGKKGYISDLLIKEDEIAKIGENLEANEAKIIDAKGKVVSPGFIDIHNHTDFTLFDDVKIEPYILQGATTLNVGMCGLGMAPSNERLKKEYFNFLSKAFMSPGVMFDNLPKFFEAIEESGISTNMTFFIPQGNVRACVLGSEERQSTEDEMESMKEIVRENMEAGAFGLSTGLVYPPGSITPTEELIELSKVVSEYDGIYDSHMRNEGSGVIDVGMKEVIRIAREANVKAHISHWSVISKSTEELTPKAIEYMEQARKEGLKITADVTVYEIGNTSLSFILLPTWVYQDFEKNLTNSKTRKKIIDEIFQKVYSFFMLDAPFYIKLIPKFILRKLLFKGIAKTDTIISTNYNHQVEGKTIYEALRELYPDKNLEEALLDFIKDEDGGIVIMVKHKDEKKSIIPLFKRDYVCPSSDGLVIKDRNCHPNSFGAFARVLQRWVREMEVVTLEEAIRKMTSLPASILSLDDRGALKEGNKADIVVFDANKIKEMGTIENGRRHPKGIDYVIVNGAITAEKGEHLGTLNGRVLKHNS